MDWNPLEVAAKEARARAYAPYSGYQVGAAVLGADGSVYAGANVENVSFGLCLCAERAAVAAMVAAGCREVGALLVVTRDQGTPCGMCRQVLSEFTGAPASLHVCCIDGVGGRRIFTLAELFPEGFQSNLQKHTP